MERWLETEAKDLESPLPLEGDESSLVTITLVYLGLPVPPTEVASREEFTVVQRIQTSVNLRQRKFVLDSKTVQFAVIDAKAHTVLDAQTQNGDEPVGEYSFLGQSCLSSADSC